MHSDETPAPASPLLQVTLRKFHRIEAIFAGDGTGQQIPPIIKRHIDRKTL
jgi:hypothetical protein